MGEPVFHAKALELALLLVLIAVADDSQRVALQAIKGLDHVGKKPPVLLVVPEIDSETLVSGPVAERFAPPGRTILEARAALLDE